MVKLKESFGVLEQRMVMRGGVWRWCADEMR